MKKNKVWLLSAALLLSAAVMPALAQAGDEARLDKAQAEVEKESGSPEGAGKVTERLKADFGVDDARVGALRDKKLGYGEISVVLALAGQLPGGINDANVQRVTDLRQGPPKTGWGKVAKSLGVKLGPVISGVKRAAQADKAGKKGQGEKRKEVREEKKDRPERAERPERPAKPERPERPAGKR